MNKSTIQKFIGLLGFHVNLDDIKSNSDVEESDDVVAQPQDGDEVEDVAAQPVVVNAAPPVVVNAAPPAAAPAPANPAPAAEAAPASNLPRLDELINAIGGFEAFKGLLLKLAEMGTGTPTPAPVANAQSEDERRLNLIVAQLVANSKGRLSPEHFSGMDAEVLLALGDTVVANSAQSVAQPAPVDFSGLGFLINKSNTVSANAELASGEPRPSFLLPQK